ncbi:diacylglycerol/lipid kinase family protein [Pseudobutyrivibrio sp.]|uniref:diacylglycerol/lipid kinase family protein n=1 Tax=Pseudobutyrivibrio sp. TaxID=2014367 RepID=UPI003868DE6F
MKNIFIVNKASRTGRAADVWDELEAYLKSENIEYEAHFTAGANDATEFAKAATSSGQKVALFVMGGDGTLNEALNGIVDFENTLYTPLPSGSANDFVSGIGLEGDALEILKRALATEEYKIFDMGKVIYDGGQRLFGVSSGIGVDAYVCLQALTSRLKKFLNKFGLGSATYGLLTVGDIFTMPFSDAHITRWFKDEVEEKDVKGTIFAAAMNCRAEGGGIPMAPNAKPDSGYLTAFYAHDISRLKCLTLLPVLVAGKHEGKGGFDLLNFDKIRIQMKDKMCVHVDGEHVGFFEDITFECIPHALKIRG